MEWQVVNDALAYLHENAPAVQTIVGRDLAEWKEFVAKPSLKFILRLLTGLAHSHETTQLTLASDSIPVFHHLEQISSDEHVGSLAENLLEAMCGHPQVKKKWISFCFYLKNLKYSNLKKLIIIVFI